MLYMPDGARLRATPINLVETKVADYWHTIMLASEEVSAVRSNVMTYLEEVLPERNREVASAAHAITDLTRQRDKLLQAHYAGAIPLDQLKSEQDRIARQLEAAHRALDGARVQRQQLEATLDRALDLLEHGGRHYAIAPTAVRRELNQAVFDRFWLIDDEIGDAKFSELFDQLHAPQDATRDKDALNKRKNRRPEDTGSDEPPLVAGTGFEPATSGL